MGIKGWWGGGLFDCGTGVRGGGKEKSTTRHAPAESRLQPGLAAPHRGSLGAARRRRKKQAPTPLNFRRIHVGSARGSGGSGLAVTAQVGAAGFAGGFDLFVSSCVGLGELHVLLGACYLTFVTLCESLVHNSKLHCGKLDPYEARLDFDFCRHFGRERTCANSSNALAATQAGRSRE